MKQRKKIPGLPSSVKYQILDFLFIHYIYVKKIAKQSNSNNKKHTKQASREKKPKH